MIAITLDHLTHLLFEVRDERPGKSLGVNRLAGLNGGAVQVNLYVGDFFPYKNPKPVTGIQNGRILRVMGSPYEVAAHVFDDADVSDGNGLRNGIAHKTVVLAAIRAMKINE